MQQKAVYSHDPSGRIPTDKEVITFPLLWCYKNNRRPDNTSCFAKLYGSYLCSFQGSLTASLKRSTAVRNDDKIQWEGRNDGLRSQKIVHVWTFLEKRSSAMGSEIWRTQLNEASGSFCSCEEQRGRTRIVQCCVKGRSVKGNHE